MAKKKEVSSPKPRARKYEGKVKFEGSLEDMIALAIKPTKKNSKDKSAIYRLSPISC
jgi:hypothetical protein